ncbi:hypothetical protein [Streptomyces sp. CC208A]|uniref:hypothetical protein n=1 Tax=Streptomyces sp. CC208A TaxID=3044573 RepID=UPI0024A975A6|nr:hypothetical protein [Streptomyces sp. CC208A]
MNTRHMTIRSNRIPLSRRVASLAVSVGAAAGLAAAGPAELAPSAPHLAAAHQQTEFTSDKDDFAWG